jgi:hypothetical protein
VKIIAASLLLVLMGCMTPTLTAQDCVEFCKSGGKAVKSYHASGVVPVFHPRANISCECE